MVITALCGPHANEMNCWGIRGDVVGAVAPWERRFRRQRPAGPDFLVVGQFENIKMLERSGISLSLAVFLLYLKTLAHIPHIAL